MITSLHGDTIEILPTLTPGSVQQIVCSPPYYALRRYEIPPTAWPAVEYQPLIGLPAVEIPPMVCQLGAEPDPLSYIAHLVHVMRLARPALRADGTLFLNLADSYSGGGGYYPDAPSNQPEVAKARNAPKAQINGARIKGRDRQTEAPQRYQLRRDLTPEQRAYVLRELAAYSEVTKPSSPDSPTSID